jgi:multidrug resistance protein, MATE family
VESNNLSRQTVVASVLKLSLPMAGSRLVQMLSGFIGMVMIAHLGKAQLAASSLINVLQITVFVIAMSILFAVGVITGEKVGAKKTEEVGAIWQQSCVLALLLSIPMMLAYWFLPSFLAILHEPSELTVYMQQYFHAAIWFIIPGMLMVGTQQIFYALLKQRIVILVDCLNLVLFTLIAHVLIFGFGVIPKLGIEGLAYASAIQMTISFLILLSCLYWRKEFKPFLFFDKHSHKGWIHIRKMFQVGFPMMCQFAGELLAFSFSTIMVGWLGLTALASMQIVTQFALLFIVPIFAVSEAVGILVSKEAGAKRYEHMRQVGNVAIVVIMCILLVSISLFIFAPHWLASFYFNIHVAKNAAMLHTITLLFMILSGTILLNSFRDLATGALRGLFDTRYPMLVGIIVMWCIMLPAGYVLGFPLHLGVVGFYASGLVALSIGAVLVWRRWHRLSRVHV